MYTGWREEIQKKGCKKSLLLTQISVGESRTMGTIQLAVCSDDRERRLTGMLEGIGTVSNVRSSEEKGAGADLLIVDTDTLRKRESPLREDGHGQGMKTSVPVILIAPQSWLSQPDPVLWGHVDEVVCAPVRRPDLEGRVHMLLTSSLSGQCREETGGALRPSGADRKELERSREQLAAAERLAGLGSWERDLDDDELNWSEETRRIFGVPPDQEFTYDRFMEVVHPEDRARLRRRQERLLEEGRPIDIEYRIRRPDGKERIVKERGEVQRREDGTPLRLFGAVLDVTERRRREEKIERLRRKYKGLLRGAPDAIVVTDAETGRVVEVNEAAASLLGASAAEIVGRHQSELHPPEKNERYQSLFERHKRRAKGGTETLSRLQDGSQIQVVTDSGERIPVEINATFVELGGRKLFVGIFRDVRRRREAERRRQILEQAVVQTKDAVFITDAEGTILYVNPATEEITGYDREELVGATPSLLRAEKTPEETHERLWSTIKQGEVFRDTITDRRKDGTLVELDQTITPIQDGSGEISHFVSTARDVTDHKRRARKLKETRRRMELALEATGAVVWDLDVQSEKVAFYPSSETLYGTEIDTLREFLAQVHPDDRNEVRERIRSGYEEGRHSAEFRIHKEGETRWIVSQGRFEADEEGRLYGTGVARDVTERKRREQELKEAKEEAEEASQMKSVFLANMSHEIRTPLTSIIGFAEAAGTEASGLEGASAGSLEQYASLIEKSGKRLLDTLEGVLNLSQLEAGQLELTPETVDLVREVRRTAEELRPKAREKEVDLQLEVEDGSVWAEADEGGVQIVLQNLLSNAIKYTEEGGAVRVRTWSVDERVALEVEDTGIGMEPEKAYELFEPFRQASEGLGRRYEGVGVGLAVTRKAVRQMDGSVEVETQKGRGTTFTVRLPKSSEARALEEET